MRCVQRDSHVEIHPSGPTVQSDVDRLRKVFPHLWPFEYVCLANPPGVTLRSPYDHPEYQKLFSYPEI